MLVVSIFLRCQVQKAMPKNLLAMAVGIKQKNVVDDIVQKVWHDSLP